MAKALDEANTRYLDNNNSPSRKAGELDNRGSNFYLALYWTRALATQGNDLELAERFTPVAQALEENASTILDELNGAQGKAVDIGGYYHPDTRLADAAMRPSATFNRILQSIA